MTMIKCPECRHHISSMAKSCPECGAPIDPAWAEAEAKKELQKLEEVPFIVEVGSGEEEAPAEEAPQAEPDKEPAAPPTLPPTGTVPSPKEENTRKKGHNGGFLIAVIVLTGLLIGALYYYEYRESEKREARAYELLQDCSNPDFYEDFMIRFPKSKHIEDVRQRYREVAKQQDEWAKLISTGTRTELQTFVRLHPTSPYVKVAQGRIDSLDWSEAQSLHSLEAVTHYIASHPDGYYIDQAEALRQTLERQKAAAAAAAAAMRDSLAQASTESEE